MAIDGQPLDSNVSHEQAISILQKARGLVELVVARSAQGNYNLCNYTLRTEFAYAGRDEVSCVRFAQKMTRNAIVVTPIVVICR